MTHSNTFEEDEPPKVDIAVGSTVNLFCLYPNERITTDKWDADPNDFIMTVLCRYVRTLTIQRKENID